MKNHYWNSTSIGFVLLNVLYFGAPPKAGAANDDLLWYFSEHSRRDFIRVGPQGQIEWRPNKPQQLTVQIPTQQLRQPGNVVRFALDWKSTGDTCGEECVNQDDWNGDNFPNDDGVDGLAGTGDFRIGLFDSNGQGYIDRDGLGATSDIFSGYLGYSWRFSPHLASDTVDRIWQYKSDGSRESHTNLTFWERTKPDVPTLLADREGLNRIGVPIAGGFALALDIQSTLILQLERVSSSIVRATIELNGVSYEVVDQTRAFQPKQIDVFSIQYPNSSDYDLVVLGTIVPEPTSGSLLVSGTLGFMGIGRRRQRRSPA